MKRFFLIGGFLLLTSCASSHQDLKDYSEYRDPLESYNRSITGFNEGVDDYFFKPAAKTYRFITPKFFRTTVNNVFENIRQPLYLANNLLQGDIKGSCVNLQRFTVNTIAGVAGIFDVATKAGIEIDKEDFGQTLAKWNVKPGPYVVLPFFGPSNFRDALGVGVNWRYEPVRWYARNTNDRKISMIKTTMEALALREKYLESLDNLKNTSVDYYSSRKAIYNQTRAENISDGTYEPEFPDFEEDFE